jgi:hypothetical protein
MHPDLMRELADQRVHEMRARARETRLARTHRGLRRRTATAAEPALPRIPDYIDGPFRDTERAA